MRDFALEVHFSKWEFNAKHHMTASDCQSMTIAELMAMASDEDRASFENCWLGYTEDVGALDLREVIAETYAQIAPDEILCFAGAEEGIYAAMRVLLSPQDHAVVVVPNYQAAETVPLEICKVSGVRLRPDQNWRLDLDALESAIRPNTKLVSVNFPNNPTGYIPSQEDFARLIEICRRHDLYLFSDEVYRGLEQDESKRLPQAADLYDKAFSLNVMSKAYGLPGLRLGWIASKQKDLLKAFLHYKHYLSICNAAPSERLALVALKARDQILARNRGLVRENLQALDGFFGKWSELFHWRHPDGGCVAYPRYKGAEGGEALCKNLIEQAGVLLLPSSLYISDLMDTPRNHFRIGCGRLGLKEGLEAFDAFLQKA